MAHTRDVVVVVVAAVAVVVVGCAWVAERKGGCGVGHFISKMHVKFCVPCKAKSPRLAAPSAQQEKVEKGASFMLAVCVWLWVLGSVGVVRGRVRDQTT
jgi:hypothetical protein